MAYHALVFGASGAIGKPLVDKLLASKSCGHVTTAGRRVVPDFDASIEKLSQVVIDMKELSAYRGLVLEGNPTPPKSDSILSLFADVDVVFICLGSTRKMGTDVFTTVDLVYPHAIAHLASRSERVAHVSLVSAVNSDPNSYLLYPRVKGEAECAVVACGAKLTSIFRPSLLITPSDRPRPDRRVAEKIGQCIQPLLMDPILGLFASTRDFCSIQVETVAAAMAAEAEAAWIRRTSTPAAAAAAAPASAAGSDGGDDDNNGDNNGGGDGEPVVYKYNTHRIKELAATRPC